MAQTILVRLNRYPDADIASVVLRPRVAGPLLGSFRVFQSSAVVFWFDAAGQLVCVDLVGYRQLLSSRLVAGDEYWPSPGLDRRADIMSELRRRDADAQLELMTTAPSPPAASANPDAWIPPTAQLVGGMIDDLEVQRQPSDLEIALADGIDEAILGLDAACGSCHTDYLVTPQTESGISVVIDNDGHLVAVEITRASNALGT